MKGFMRQPPIFVGHSCARWEILAYLKAEGYPKHGSLRFY